MKMDVAGQAVRTTCAYCGVGCGVLARSGANGMEITGDPGHPANGGRLCVKGAALGETLGLEGRLLEPMLREGGSLRPASWDDAIGRVAKGFARVVAEHGPDAVALYVSGQLLTEDYYVANKFMKGYVGSANIDTNSRLCMSSAVAGHKRAFGADLVPGCYEDLDEADLVILAGSNAAWCHPVLYQRIAQARARRPGMQLVVIDPRHTASCEGADLHLPIRPGTDVSLFNGLLRWLAAAGAVDEDFVAGHTTGADAALVAVAAYTPEHVAQTCRVKLDDVLDFYRRFTSTRRVVTAFSQGVNQSSSGTDKVNAIINCHLLTGRIGQPGMGPFSLTGQPNAMGGREVGGLATTLAAHLDFDQPGAPAMVRAFWNSPTIATRPGMKAVDLFDAIDAGTVKAVWIMATNPVVSMPDADRVRRALARCDLVVVSEVMADTDTTACADVLLPALAWGEKDGTVTNSERVISRQRPFLPAPGDARPDWRIVCDVARRMGFSGFGFASAAEVFDEHARLSAWHNEGRRCFDLGPLAGMDGAAYDALEPTRWPVGAPARLFGDGRFAHADGRARIVPTPARAPGHAPGEEYPLVLNTGRVRDQWHTMTRTGKAARLAAHTPEGFIDMHPHDALLHGVRDGELARVSSHWGAMVGRVRHGGGVARGSVFVPIHWNGRTASDARIGAVVNPAVDPLSGEPEFKHTPVRVEPFTVDWHAFVIARTPVEREHVTYWTRVAEANAVRHELAGRVRHANPAQWARALLGASAPDADWIDYADATEGVYRAALLQDDRLMGCVFLSARPDLPPRAWLAGLFAQEQIDPGTRAALLAGGPLGRSQEKDEVVCACFGVGAGTIRAAIAAHGLRTAQEVTACVRAGGNCGSCVPEIRRLLAAQEAFG
jgi:assimilatory nitrate reductase catalytic subunit